jgi:hypothetical protein
MSDYPKFCKNCGKRLDPDEKFCSDCGKMISGSTSVDKETINHPISQTENFTSKKLPLKVISFIFIILFAISMIIIFSLIGKNKSGNSASNNEPIINTTIPTILQTLPPVQQPTENPTLTPTIYVTNEAPDWNAIIKKYIVIDQKSLKCTIAYGNEFYYLSGVVTNTSDTITFKNIWLAGYAKNPEGNIVALGGTYPDKFTLVPHTSSSFSDILLGSVSEHYTCGSDVKSAESE